MNFGQAIQAGFKNYVNFKGTATRPEYWYWILFSVLVRIVVSSAGGFTAPGTSNLDVQPVSTTSLASSALSGLVSLALFLPTLGVTIRRFRDVGRSPKLLLLSLVPGVLMVVAISVLAVSLASIGGLNEANIASHLSAVLPGIALFLLTAAVSLGIGIWFIVILAKPSKPQDPPVYDSTAY